MHPDLLHPRWYIRHLLVSDISPYWDTPQTLNSQCRFTWSAENDHLRQDFPYLVDLSNSYQTHLTFSRIRNYCQTFKFFQYLLTRHICSICVLCFLCNRYSILWVHSSRHYRLSEKVYKAVSRGFLPIPQCVRYLRLHNGIQRFIKLHQRQTIFQELCFWYSFTIFTSKKHMCNWLYLIFSAPLTTNIRFVTNCAEQCSDENTAFTTFQKVK